MAWNSVAVELTFSGIMKFLQLKEYTPRVRCDPEYYTVDE